MRKTLIILLVVLSYINIHAQEQTRHSLFGGRNVEKHRGNYAALTMGMGELNDLRTGIIGVRAMGVKNHWLAMGISANGIFTVEDEPYVNDIRSVKYYGGYGGFIINPIIFSSVAIHFSGSMTVGGGWIGQYENIQDSYTNYTDNSAGFWYLEPGLELEINLSEGLTASFGAFYMIQNNVADWSNINPILGDISYLVLIKWGIF